ncbi:hypothetical protein [Ornithinimicrobium kibberense]|uniref:Uncharacterized protein n=1 Tax=Ornithinimicrobium kibberense TaxID=282060 RepID=A0ABV5V4S7_9MICO|nr:hypothetical protein [Ornithinimicrobium kibberense]
MHRIVRRGLLATAAGTAAVAMAAGSASAHHCFVPMYTLNGPSSPNWFVVSAEEGAMFEAGYVTACEGAVDAGYAALHEAGLPVAIKIFEKMTIGDPKGTGRMNPNGADGRGLEYFGAGSTLPFEMVGTYIEGAESHDCG